MIVCQVCGTENPDGARYCEGCGVELSPGTAVQEGTPAAPVAAQPAPPQLAPAEPAPYSPAAASPAPEPSPTAPAQSSPAADPADALAPIPPDAQSEGLPEPTATAEVAPAALPALPADLEPVAEGAPVVSGDAVAVPQGTPPVGGSGEAAAVAPTDPAPVGIPASVPAGVEAPVPTPPSAGPATNARLVLKRMGAESGDTYPLAGGRLSVGRFDPSTGPVDLDVSGLPGAEHVSRRHAELALENGRWTVRDLGSTNGVYVKRAGESGFGARLQAPQTLGNGDEVAFGNLTFVYRDGANPA